MKEFSLSLMVFALALMVQGFHNQVLLLVLKVPPVSSFYSQMVLFVFMVVCLMDWLAKKTSSAQDNPSNHLKCLKLHPGRWSESFWRADASIRPYYIIVSQK